MGKGSNEQRTPVEQPDNLKSSQHLKMLLLLGEGEIVGPVNGLKDIYLNDTPILDESGEPNFRGVKCAWNVGTQSQPPLKEFTESETETMVSTEVKKSAPIIRTINNSNVDRVRVSLGVSALFKYEENGDLKGSNVQLEVQVEENGTWNTREVIDIKGKTRSQYLRSVVLTDLPAAPFSIRVLRTTDDSTSSKLENKTLWSSFTEIIDSRLSYPNTAILGLEVDASQLNSVPKVSTLIRGRRIRVPSNYNPETREYSGIWNGTFKIAYSNNPAWIFYDLLTCSRSALGKRLFDENVDKWSLYQIAQYCDQLVDDGYGNQEPRMTVNVVIRKAREAYSVLRDLCNVFRAMPVWSGMEMSARADIPGDAVNAYTNANVIDGKFTYQGTPLKKRYTAVHVTYMNPTTWKKETLYVSDDAAIARFGLNVAKLTAWGCTSKGQANRAGVWLLATNRMERYVVTFKVATEGLKHLPGDIIETYDNAYVGANVGGRVLAIDGNKVTLDRDVKLVENEQATFSFLDENVKTVRLGVMAQLEPHILLLDKEPHGLSTAGVWSLSLASAKPRLWRCTDIAESKGIYTISALQHEPQKQAYVDNGVKFEAVDHTLYSGKIPIVERLQVELLPDDTLNQVRISWDTPRVVDNINFKVKLLRDGAIHKEKTVEETEVIFHSLPLGRYTAKVRGIDSAGRLGHETTVAFTISAPTMPTDIIFETDNFSVTARPKVSRSTLGTEYEWHYGTTKSQVESKKNPLGRGAILNHQGRKPDTKYYYGVEAINAVGRSGMLIRSTKTKLSPSDILDIIGPEIPKLDWSKNLKNLVENNSSNIVLLSDRAALVVNKNNRVTGMTVTANDQASAIDFMSDFVSFTDPDTLQRNLYWDNIRKTLVVKGELRLLDGTRVSGSSDLASAAGGVFRIKTSTGAFPSNSAATALFKSKFNMEPSRDTVLTLYALNSNGTVKNVTSRMFDGSRWIKPKVMIDGDLITLGTIKGDRLVAGTEIYSPRLIAAEIISSGNPPTFSLSPSGRATLRNADVAGKITATSGRMTNVVIEENCVVKGRINASQVTGSKLLRKSGSVNVGGRGNLVDKAPTWHRLGLIDTGYVATAWGSNRATYVVECSVSGHMDSSVDNARNRPSEILWAARSKELFILTKWTGAATVRFELEFFTQYCLSRSDARVNWKLYELI